MVFQQENLRWGIHNSGTEYLWLFEQAEANGIKISLISILKQLKGNILGPEQIREKRAPHPKNMIYSGTVKILTS